MPPLQDLTSCHQVLHLTHHRNQNQHRLSKWYKPFSQLRRQVAKLILEVEALETAEKFSTAGTSTGKKNGEGREESKYVKAAREKVELRVRFLRRWVVGGCYLAFSNLVADNQYSVLGLTLLGTLARVNSVLARLVEDEDDERQEEAVVDETAEVMEAEASSDMGEKQDHDFGEVVRREEILAAVEGKGSNVVEGEEKAVTEKPRSKKRLGIDKNDTPSKAESTPSKPPKKKRKEGKGKGDALDDLFSSLL